jgi:drug/metabolite transporter (DMT)-like permease
VYLILSFCYILPTAYYGWFNNSIPISHLIIMSKKPFMIMGLLDAVAGAMQVLATIYLPGTMLVLLPQAAIPLSMLASGLVLRERFTQYQYLGAIIVFAGIIVVLFPVLTQAKAPNFSCQAINEEQDCMICQSENSQEDCESHRRSNAPNFMTAVMVDDVDFNCRWISKDQWLREEDFLTVVWSLVMLVSCIPMVMSTVYKQVALQVQLDPILINGWVSLFQLVGGIFLVVPAGYASSPKVEPMDLPENWAQATVCLFARSNSIESGCHPDECSQAALWVHLGLLSSILHTVSMVLVLKYGSASLLYLGLTLMVPMGHLVFSLHDSSDTRTADIVGLIVLVAGLLLFRFGHDDGSDPQGVDDSTTDYTLLPQGDDGPYDSVAPESSATISVSGRDETGGARAGFLEFLREPFLLVGDI